MIETIEHVDEKGRKYVAETDGKEHILIVGPPEGLVDALGLPEEIATRLHNILYRRKLLNFQAIQRRPAELRATIQELYNMDIQRLHEAFFQYENGG